MSSRRLAGDRGRSGGIRKVGTHTEAVAGVEHARGAGHDVACDQPHARDLNGSGAGFTPRKSTQDRQGDGTCHESCRQCNGRSSRRSNGRWWSKRSRTRTWRHRDVRLALGRRRRMSDGCAVSPSSVAWAATSLARDPSKQSTGLTGCASGSRHHAKESAMPSVVVL